MSYLVITGREVLRLACELLLRCDASGYQNGSRQASRGCEVVRVFNSSDAVLNVTNEQIFNHFYNAFTNV